MTILEHPQMDLDLRVEPDQTVVAVHGELDLSTAPDLRWLLDELIAEMRSGPIRGCRRLVLDVSELRFADTAGLCVFICAHQDVADAGGELHLIGATPNLVRLLKVTHLTFLLG